MDWRQIAVRLLDFRRFLAAIGLVDFAHRDRSEADERAARRRLDVLGLGLAAMAAAQLVAILCQVPDEMLLYVGNVSHAIGLPERFLAVVFCGIFSIVAINERIFVRIWRLRHGTRPPPPPSCGLFSATDVLYSDQLFDGLRPLYARSLLSADRVRSHSRLYSWGILGLTAFSDLFMALLTYTLLAIYGNYFGLWTATFWLVAVPICLFMFVWGLYSMHSSLPLLWVFYMETRYYRLLLGELSGRLRRIRYKACLGRLAADERRLFHPRGHQCGGRAAATSSSASNQWSYWAQRRDIVAVLEDHARAVHQLTAHSNRDLWRYYLAAVVLLNAPLAVLMMYIVLFSSQALPPVVGITFLGLLLPMTGLIVQPCIFSALVTKQMNLFNKELIRFLIKNPDKDISLQPSGEAADLSRKFIATIKLACTPPGRSTSAATFAATFTVYEWFHLDFYTIVEIALQSISYFLLIVQVREDLYP